MHGVVVDLGESSAHLDVRNGVMAPLASPEDAALTWYLSMTVTRLYSVSRSRLMSVVTRVVYSWSASSKLPLPTRANCSGDTPLSADRNSDA